MASVDHDYCLRLTALCLAEPMMLVTQLMNYGSVVSFFQKYRERVTEIMLLTWSKQIAEGMTYLESRGIVHRDLAARNILVKKFDHIKITDFGLARVIESNEAGIHVHEFSLVPFKWLAIESIKDRLFNHKSDVWSYGICIWGFLIFYIQINYMFI
jgi:serine/threonine protein kinase